jgi:phosphoserine aminotransferase
METLKRLIGCGDDFEVLFLGGGASMQFLMVPLNFCPDNQVANYIDTGAWSTKALKEATKAGKKMHVAATSGDQEFTYIPKEFKLSDNPAYLHITTNNTIRGTEFHEIPEVPAELPLVADMSSNFLSRPYDFSKFSLIYAGAQKNVGPAGVTIVLIRKDYKEKLLGNLPTMLDYNTHLAKGSMFNTPPTFPIYVVGKVLHWIEDFGGLKEMEKHNIEKADYVYDVFESTEFYKGTVVKEDRSRMNIPFRLPSEELEKKFIEEAKANRMNNLKGHRSVGGCRASLYNSLPMESAKALNSFMKEFEKKNS